MNKIYMFTIGLLLAGCSLSADGKSDGMPPAPDGKTDGLRSPTSHGNLVFGRKERAEITDDERFHAWEFEITETTHVLIEFRAPDTGLDLVAYLYGRQSTEESWGSYIVQEDDTDGSVQPTIVRTLEAGLYRLVVTGYDYLHVGRFTVEGGCIGDRCGELRVDLRIPAPTPFGVECVEPLRRVLNSDVLATEVYDVPAGADEGAPPAVLVAADHYQAEIAHYDDVEVTFDPRNTGSIVRVGDDPRADYVFDDSDNLISVLVHSPTPRVDFFCGARGETADPPSASCLAALMTNGRIFDWSLESELFNYPSEEPATGVTPSLAKALQTYREDQGLAGEEELGVSADQWRGEGGTFTGGYYSINASGLPVVKYFVVESPWERDATQIIFEGAPGEQLEMSCRF